MSNRGAASATLPHVRALSAPTRGSPGFAAFLSLLLPGLGQMYRGRWVRGALMILLPIFTVLLTGAFVAIADPVTSFVLRNAAAITFLVASALFMYHLFVVADAFAGKLRDIGSLRGRLVVDYLVLGDNSPASSDSRTWGTVPQRLMLGRALMVYFPFDRFGPIR